MSAINSEGVSASRVFLPADQSHPNLLQFFIAQFPHIEANEWERRFAEGLIFNLKKLYLKHPFLDILPRFLVAFIPF